MSPSVNWKMLFAVSAKSSTVNYDLEMSSVGSICSVGLLHVDMANLVGLIAFFTGMSLRPHIMVERGTGRPRGFGFLTFADRRGMEDAIREMHGRELGDRIISVNRAEPKPGDDPVGGSYGGGGGNYSSSGPRGGYRGSDRAAPERQDECFKCGRLGHWARDCPSAGGGGGGGRGARDPPFPSRPRYGDIGSRGDRFSERDRYLDDRYDGGLYAADRDRFDSRDKYGARDRFVADRYPPGDRYGGGDRFRGSDRYPQNGYEKDRGYDRSPVGRRGGDRYGGGSGGAVRAGARFTDRPGPYDRPARGGRQSSFDRY